MSVMPRADPDECGGIGTSATFGSSTIGTVAGVRITILAEASTRNGGSGSHVWASARALVGAGHDVVVIADEADEADVSFPGLSAHRTTELGREGVVAVVATGRPDVVHVHDLQDPELVTELARRWPTVASIHSHSTCPSGMRYFRGGEVCTRVAGPGCAANLALRGCGHRGDPRPLVPGYRAARDWLDLLAAAHRVVTYSAFMGAQAARDTSTPVDVVPLFVSGDLIGPASPRATREILVVARLVATKGVDVLLTAVTDIDANLRVVGEGWQRADLERDSHRRGIADRVRFDGWLGAADLAHAYATTTVTCVPSVWPEPFGQVGIEALANACPVVGTAVGGTSEWLRDRETGLSVPPGDPDALRIALAETIADAELAFRLGATGRSLVAERFSPAAHVDALERTYALTIDAARTAA